MPSGAGYALAVREVVAPEIEAPLRPRPLDDYARAAAAPRSSPPRPAAATSRPAAILSDGPQNGAWYEHERLGRELGLPILTPRPARGRAAAASSPAAGASARQVDVIYRRLDDDRLAAPDGTPTALGELLLPALRVGPAALRQRLRHRPRRRQARPRLRRADDRVLPRRGAAAALGAELSTSPTSSNREAAMERLDGAGDQAARRVRRPRGDDHAAGRPSRSASARSGCCAADPSDFIAQETVADLQPPDGRAAAACAPRRIDLRPFVVSGPGGETAMTGGLTRYAREAGEMVVNSSQRRRLQGHLGARGAAMKRRSLASLRRPAPDRGHDLGGAAGRAGRRRSPRASRAAARWRSGSPTCGRSRRPAACRW